MVNLTIDNKKVRVPEGSTILKAATKVGVHIPTLCHLEGINEIGACKVCVVELEGNDKLISACNSVVEEGMVIYTNSPKVRDTRRTNVELILSDHDCRCAVCARSGNCSLQKVANDLGIVFTDYEPLYRPKRWNKKMPIIRDNSKCINCMRCIQVCDKIQGLNIWDVSGTGSRTVVDVSRNRKFKESDCSYCGQCITHCPTGALRERDDVLSVLEALADPETVTVVQIAPSIRTAWGESLGLKREEATVNRLVAALRHIGFDYIINTDFSADLTIMEEGSEFLERYTHRDKYQWPMFTSCCPAWVRFIKSQYPDMVNNLSTAKSPQQMFGAIVKSYYADLLDIPPEKIFSLSIMPCVAKKSECDLPTMNDAGFGKDVDCVLTTRELVRLIRSENIMLGKLEEEEFDAPLGTGSTAGSIFGATGGVMEAALRTAYNLVTGKNPEPDTFKDVRGINGWKEASFDLEGNPVRVAIASGLGNARNLIESIRTGESEYDFVEIMSCPGGCTGGGGQPIWDGKELAEERGKVLYGLDKISELRFSHENPSIKKCYSEYFQKPLSHRSHDLLHTDHNGWKMPNEE